MQCCFKMYKSAYSSNLNSGHSSCNSKLKVSSKRDEEKYYSVFNFVLFNFRTWWPNLLSLTFWIMPVCENIGTFKRFKTLNWWWQDSAPLHFTSIKAFLSVFKMQWIMNFSRQISRTPVIISSNNFA